MWISLLVLLFLSACNPAPEQTSSSQAVATLYHGGDILTMAGDSPQYAEALVEQEGRIVFVGSYEEAAKQFTSSSQVDLQDRTLLPGFVDGHSHFSFAINAVNQANLASPPVGEVRDFKTLIDALSRFRDERGISAGDWIVGWGYDPTGLDEQAHITKIELDNAFPDHPVMLIHVSGHGAVLNSMALDWAGIDASTETPEGGVIARLDGSDEPAGLLMETAYLPVFSNLPKPSEDEMLELLDEAQQIYASAGFTHAQDGAAHVYEYELLQKAADAGLLYIDIASLAIFTEMDEWFSGSFEFGQYHNHLKLQGVKIAQDGSPQGKTAYMTQPYITGGPDGEQEWYGEPTMPYEEFRQVFEQAASKSLPVFVHVNGDAAIDDLIRAVETAGLSASDDHRTVAIHSQFQRPDHLERYRELGITPSYFVSHVFFWGGEHIANQGIERASFISPLAAAGEAGIVYSTHTDFNVTPMDVRYVLHAATTRLMRDGQVLGEDQKVSTYTALKSVTSGAAYQVFEENRKGSLQPGFLADFVILDRNPLKIEPDALLDLNVVATIKEGRTIFGEL